MDSYLYADDKPCSMTIDVPRGVEGALTRDECYLVLLSRFESSAAHLLDELYPPRSEKT